MLAEVRKTNDDSGRARTGFGSGMDEVCEAVQKVSRPGKARARTGLASAVLLALLQNLAVAKLLIILGNGDPCQTHPFY